MLPRTAMACTGCFRYGRLDSPQLLRPFPVQQGLGLITVKLEVLRNIVKCEVIARGCVGLRVLVVLPLNFAHQTLPSSSVTLASAVQMRRLATRGISPFFVYRLDFSSNAHFILWPKPSSKLHMLTLPLPPPPPISVLDETMVLLAVPLLTA